MQLFQKRKAKHYKMEYITFGEWTLESYTKIPKVEYLSADTETKLYLDGEPISSEVLYSLTSKMQKPNDYIKKNIEVRAYAFMLSDGSNFALFQCIEDFLLTCAMMRVKRVYWYNARFDFAIFDDKKVVALIECQGEQHYKESSKYYNDTLFLRDKMKKEFCKEKGIPLIEIPYSDYDKIDTEYIRRVMKL